MRKTLLSLVSIPILATSCAIKAGGYEVEPAAIEEASNNFYHEIRAILGNYDTNKDSKISRNEMRELLQDFNKALGRKHKAQKTNPPKTYNHSSKPEN